jgi:hypothetical protein
MSDLELEMTRIRSLADRLYSDFKDEPDWEQMLACLLLRLPADYFNREIYNRETTTKLLAPNLKDQAVMMHQLVGMSDFSAVLKYRVCSAVEAYLRKIGADAAEIEELKSSFDVQGFLDKMWKELGA